MTNVTLDIKKWGNSLGVRLPAAIAREAHLHIDQKVKVSVVDDQVIISPINDDSLILEQRLERFNLLQHSGESMIVDEHLGAENW